MTAIVLAHLSDPHLPPLPMARLRELAGKRALGYLNWKRNRHAIHRRDVLDLLVADMQAQRPEHIAITGDLVNLALPAEFAPARAWLESVGAPDRVTLVPGNHDAYVRATQHRFASEWRAYLGDDNPDAGYPTAFPFVRRRGSLALIGLSSAVPSAPLMATGRLGRAQLAALEHILRQPDMQNLFRVLLVHHPLRTPDSRRHARLTDSKALLNILHRHGVDLVLHGHDHRHSTMWFDGPERRKIPAVGVPSASVARRSHGDAAAYNLFTISRDAQTWRIDMRVRGLLNDGTLGDIRNARLI